jgi:hypothetical protein
MGTIALITPARRHNGKPLFHSSPTFSILKSVGMPQSSGSFYESNIPNLHKKVLLPNTRPNANRSNSVQCTTTKYVHLCIFTIEKQRKVKIILF